MFMGLKKQMLTCRFPQEVLLLTTQHLEELTKLTTNPDAISCISDAKERFMTRYYELSATELLQLRGQVLAFAQSRNVRVSLFLENETQTKDGNLVVVPPMHGGYLVSKPGTIKWTAKKLKESSQIPKYTQFIEEFEVKWERVSSKLGENIYALEKTKKSTTSPSTVTSSAAVRPKNVKNSLCLSSHPNFIENTSPFVLKFALFVSVGSSFNFDRARLLKRKSGN